MRLFYSYLSRESFFLLQRVIPQGAFHENLTRDMTWLPVGHDWLRCRTGRAADEGALVRTTDVGALVRILGAGALGRAPTVGATGRVGDPSASSCLKT